MWVFHAVNQRRLNHGIRRSRTRGSRHHFWLDDYLKIAGSKEPKSILTSVGNQVPLA